MLRRPKPADCRLSNVLIAEHPAGVEPARPTWQAGRLPLHHGCAFSPVGPEGLEPSRRGLRDRYAAASTLVPPLVISRVGGTRTLTSSLKRRVRCRYATTPKGIAAGV